MQALIEVFPHKAMEQACNGEDLHAFLGVETRCCVWLPRRLKYCRLVEGRDFVPTLVQSSGGRRATNYILSVDAAKHIAMAERTEKGFQAREYFIEVEKRHRASVGSARSVARIGLSKAELRRFAKTVMKLTLKEINSQNVVAARVQTSFAEEIPEGLRKYLAVEVRGRFIYEGFPLKRANAVAKDVRICLESQEYTHRGRLVYELKPDAPEFRVRKSGPPFGMYYIHRDHMPLFDEAYRKTIAATPRLRRDAAPTLFNLHGA